MVPLGSRERAQSSLPKCDPKVRPEASPADRGRPLVVVAAGPTPVHEYDGPRASHPCEFFSTTGGFSVSQLFSMSCRFSPRGPASDPWRPSPARNRSPEAFLEVGGRSGLRKRVLGAPTWLKGRGNEGGQRVCDRRGVPKTVGHGSARRVRERVQKRRAALRRRSALRECCSEVGRGSYCTCV